MMRVRLSLALDRKAFVDIRMPTQPLHSSKIVKRRNRHHATYYGPIAPAGSHDFPSGVTSRLRSTKTTKATREGPPGGHCADPYDPSRQREAGAPEPPWGWGGAFCKQVTGECLASRPSRP